MINACLFDCVNNEKCVECGTRANVKEVHFHGPAKDAFFRPMCEMCFKKMVPPPMVSRYAAWLNQEEAIKF